MKKPKEEEPEREWMMIGLDPKVARRQGMPPQIPVPKDRFEGLADKGLNPDELRGWIKEFFATVPTAQDGNWRRRNAVLVSALEGFVDMKPQWEKAQKAFAEADFEKAIAALKRITTMVPDDHAARMNYASALANAGQYDKAMKQLVLIRESFAGEPDYHLAVAQLHVAKGNTEEAIAELVQGLEARPDHLPSMDALAKLGVLVRIYENPRDPGSLTYVKADAVLGYLKGRWDEEPRGADFYLALLAYHESERRHDVALEAAERAIGAHSGLCERAEIGKIAALCALGRLPEATAAAHSLCERAPRSAGAHVELCKCLARAGDAAGARAEVERALECDPGDQEALVLRFWPEDTQAMAKVQEAIPALESYAAAHAGAAGAWRSLARAKLVVGADEEASALFEKAVVLDPGDDDLRAEWWHELHRAGGYQRILDDVQRLGDMARRSWQLRWNEAEAYRALGKMMEARACYAQLNQDDSLSVAIRKRAKRAASDLGAPPGAGGPEPAPARRVARRKTNRQDAKGAKIESDFVSSLAFSAPWRFIFLLGLRAKPALCGVSDAPAPIGAAVAVLLAVLALLAVAV
ncbi:MAG: tetratricopeptide repeat protein [Deltaproteobacteria bacterium]|nr:tetratricopeptide repeat protein [Deltaproteobacteria bacterium]